VQEAGDTFHLPQYLQELLDDLDVSQPLLRADAVHFKEEAKEVCEESLAEDAKDGKEQEDEAAAAQKAQHIAILAQFAQQTLGKRKKQKRRKVGLFMPKLEPQIIWKPDANGGRPVPKREDLRGHLANQEGHVEPAQRPSTVPSSRGGSKKRPQKGRCGESKHASTHKALPELEVMGLDVLGAPGAGSLSLAEWPRARTATPDRRRSTPDPVPSKLVESPFMVKAVPGRGVPPVRQFRRLLPSRIFEKTSTLDSVSNSNRFSDHGEEEDFDRQISPVPGPHFGPQRHGPPGGHHSEMRANSAPADHDAPFFFEGLELAPTHQTFLTGTESNSPSHWAHDISQDALSSESLGAITVEPDLEEPEVPHHSQASQPANTHEEASHGEKVCISVNIMQAPDVDLGGEKHPETVHHQAALGRHEPNVSFHSVDNVAHSWENMGSLQWRDASLEEEAAESAERQYLVPPWALREHLHLGAENHARHPGADDFEMDPEVCAILKGLEKAPALQSSRPSSRASRASSRPGDGSFTSLANAIYAPRGIASLDGNRVRRHLVTPVEPELPWEGQLKRSGPAESRPGNHVLGTSMLSQLHPSRCSVRAQIASQCMALLRSHVQVRRRARSRGGTATATTFAQAEEDETERPATKTESWRFSGSEDSATPRESPSPGPGGRTTTPVDVKQRSLSEEIFE